MIEHGPQTNGVSRALKYYEGPDYTHDDVAVSYRQFTYETDAGRVAGNQISVLFVIDRPAKEVWPYLKDFNLWQNSYGYYYSGVVGDLYSRAELGLGEEGFHISIKQPDEPAHRHPYQYQVLRVVPERLIVIFQPVTDEHEVGGISPGFHVFMLNEHQGKTTVSVYLEHASRTRDLNEEDALQPWRQFAPEAQRFWREIFIPHLKRLVYDGK